jgi:hypothetical protein
MLFVELAVVVVDWLWHSGMIGNKSGLRLSCFGRPTVRSAKAKMRNNVGDGEPIALCG